jgi:uncharacterized membrane protein YphA (DoxX/SURF4 family)
MRLVAGSGLIANGAIILLGGPPAGTSILSSLQTAAGLLLLVGLWTPIAGTLATFIEIWHALSNPADPWIYLLLATLAAALAMIGPGVWSVDAHLFGLKRIDIPARKS